MRYYTVCAVMGATALGIIALSYKKPRSDRIFFYLCASICMTATVSINSLAAMAV